MKGHETKLRGELLERRELKSAGLCFSGSFAGIGAQACIGTSGISNSASIGPLVAGRQTNWGGSNSRCLGISAGGGLGPFAEVSYSRCASQGRNQYVDACLGAGVGLGVKGDLSAALSAQLCKSMPIATIPAYRR